MALATTTTWAASKGRICVDSTLVEYACGCSACLTPCEEKDAPELCVRHNTQVVKIVKTTEYFAA